MLACITSALIYQIGFDALLVPCHMPKERMGGIRIYKRGVGDDSHQHATRLNHQAWHGSTQSMCPNQGQDIVSDFETWREGGLWEHVKTAVAEVKKEGPLSHCVVIVSDHAS